MELGKTLLGLTAGVMMYTLTPSLDNIVRAHPHPEHPHPTPKQKFCQCTQPLAMVPPIPSCRCSTECCGGYCSNRGPDRGPRDMDSDNLDYKQK